MDKIHTYIFIALYIIFSSIKTSYSQILTISDLSTLEKKIKETNIKHNLIIFDIDHVLIMTTDSSTRNRHPYRLKLWSDIKRRSSEEKLNLLESIVTKNSRWQIVNPKILSTLEYLKNNGINTIALTSRGTDRLGVIDSLADLTHENLENCGISIPYKSPLNKYLVLDNLKGKRGNPMLDRGIIFTADFDKGKILEAILRTFNYYPEHIWFVDDKINNLHSVSKMCNKLNIKFTGWHYISNAFIPKINKKIEKKRFNNLEKFYKWQINDTTRSRAMK